MLKNYRHHHHSDRNYIFYLAETILINMRIERFDTINIGPVVIAPLSHLKFSNLFSSLFSASMRFSAHIYAYFLKSHIFVIRIFFYQRFFNVTNFLFTAYIHVSCFSLCNTNISPELIIAKNVLQRRQSIKLLREEMIQVYNTDKKQETNG